MADRYRTKTVPTFELTAASVAVLDGKTVNEVITAARDRSDRTEYVPFNQVVFGNDGKLDNGMMLSDTGLTRLCSITKISRRVVNTLVQSDGRDIAADALRCLMRNRAEDSFAVIDGVVEGVISKEYARISNGQAVEVLSESLMRSEKALEDLRVVRARFEGTHLRLSVVGEIARELAVKGDPVNAGIELLNGEDGSMSADVEGFLYRLICSNGAIARAPGGERGSVIHRGKDPVKRLIPLIDDAVEASVTMMGRLVPATQVILDRTNLHDQHLRTVERFGNGFANDVNAKAAEEHAKSGRANLTAYDYWNGITFQAHSAASLSRARSIEEFGSSILEWAGKRFRRQGLADIVSN